MNKTAYLSQMRRIAAIRALQLEAAETCAMKAMKASRLALADTARELQILVRCEEDWHEALGASLASGLASFRAVTLTQQAHALEQAQIRSTDADKALHSECQHWKMAILQCDLAAALERKAHKACARAREEQALNAMSDLYLQQRGKLCRP